MDTRRRRPPYAASLSGLLAIMQLGLLLVFFPSHVSACPYEFSPMPLDCTQPQLRTQVLVVGIVAVVAQLVVAALLAAIRTPPQGTATPGFWLTAAAAAVVATAAVIFLAVTQGR